MRSQYVSINYHFIQYTNIPLISQSQNLYKQKIRFSIAIKLHFS